MDTTNAAQQASPIVRLRALSTEAASADIRLRHPEYVHAVQTFFNLTDDLEAIFVASGTRTPQNVRPWAQLLTAMFDFEHVRDKFIDALIRAKRAADSGSSDDFDYHREHWVFQGGAFIDRDRNLIKKAIRLLAAKSRSDRRSTETALIAQLNEKAGTAWKSVRDPLAHELGGGVAALTPYWLPILALDRRFVDIEHVVRGMASGANEAKAPGQLTSLADDMTRTTGVVIAECERVIDTLIDRLARSE